jgi:SAM-dependent methyltransferase
MDPSSAINLGLSAKQRTEDTSELAVYDQTLRAGKADKTRELVGGILAREEEMRSRVREETESADGETRPRGAWRWVEGASYWLNTETGERSWKTPQGFDGRAAGSADEVGPSERLRLSPSGDGRRIVQAQAKENGGSPSGANCPSLSELGQSGGRRRPAGRAEGSPTGRLRRPSSASFQENASPEEGLGAATGEATLADRPEEELARVQSVAEAYGYAAALAAEEDRNKALTIELRRANNFVKDGPIRVCLAFWAHVLAAGGRERPPPPGADPRALAAPRLEVLDLCCGRGQDFDKYRRACRDSFAVLAKLVGVDIAGRDAAASARERWAQVADRVLHDTREAGTAVMMGGVLTADISTVHAARAIDDAAERARFDADSVPAAGSAHLASCYFALHYFFRSEEALRNLLAGASWLLRDGGFFAAIHADGEAIAAAFAAAGGQHRTFRIGHATVTLHEGTAAMLRDVQAEGGTPPPYGWGYDFYLPNAVEHVTEYLVHSPARDRMAEQMHLVKILDEPADGLLARMVTVPFWREAYDKCEVDTRRAGSLAPETLDGLAMYRVVIYAKSPLRADIHAVRRFVRAKLGFPP